MARPAPDSIVQYLEEKLSYRFKDAQIAVHALTHSSAKEKDLPCNERFEFLGDAILGYVVSEHLFARFPQCEEGELSTMKSIIVSARTLADEAVELGLDQIVILGRGLAEKKSIPRSILCNAFEALLAAMFLDSDLETVRAFILRTLQRKIDEILKNEHEKNYKSLLQDYAQRHLSVLPSYRVTKEAGPDHKKMFQVMVELGQERYGPAWGGNKKEAEQQAARQALIELGLFHGEATPE